MFDRGAAAPIPIAVALGAPTDAATDVVAFAPIWDGAAAKAVVEPKTNAPMMHRTVLLMVRMAHFPSYE